MHYFLLIAVVLKIGQCAKLTIGLFLNYMCNTVIVDAVFVTKLGCMERRLISVMLGYWIIRVGTGCGYMRCLS